MKNKYIAYPNLVAEMARKGVSREELARKLFIATRSLSLRLTGLIDFRLAETKTIAKLFPDHSYSYLFKTAEEYDENSTKEYEL